MRRIRVSSGTLPAPASYLDLFEVFLYGVQDKKGAVQTVISQNPADSDAVKEQKLAAMVCSLENKDACLMCGS